MEKKKETAGTYEDVKINVKIKLSALWASMLFLFAYGDIFMYFRPGIIKGIMSGKAGDMNIGQGFLMFSSAYIAIPCLMIVLSLILKAKANRWTNIIVASVYALSIAGFCIGENWFYYIFLSAIECGLLLAAVRLAWKWPLTDKNRMHEDDYGVSL